MFDLGGKYCGDEIMAERLSRVGSSMSIHGVYGLFHGCIAAPVLVMPSQYIPLILGKDKEFDTLDQVKELMGDLMGLWNLIAKWNPNTSRCLVPAIKYRRTSSALEARAADDISFITYFLRGLQLGGTDEYHLSNDMIDEMEYLLQIQELLKHYANVSEMDGADKQVNIRESFKIIDDMEKTIGDSVAAINTGLKVVRMQRAQEMRQPYHHTIRREEPKIGRNELCPCGSGKKYKKCCGIVH